MGAANGNLEAGTGDADGAAGGLRVACVSGPGCIVAHPTGQAKDRK